jgi:hypothetical protein
VEKLRANVSLMMRYEFRRSGRPITGMSAQAMPFGDIRIPKYLAMKYI